jgi:V8-like Glu-specific endopeptidase
MTNKLIALLALGSLAGCETDMQDPGTLATDEQSLSTPSGTVTPDWFPEVIHYDPPGCTATKIARQKFLTAAHCLLNLNVGDTIQFTNDPAGLWQAAAGAIKTSTIRSLHMRSYSDPFDPTQDDDVGVFTINNEAAPVYPAMRLMNEFAGDGTDWFTQVGYGADAIDDDDFTKQKAEFFASYLSYWQDNMSEPAAWETSVFNRYLIAWTDDAETRAGGDSGGPAAVWVKHSGWHLIGVHSRNAPKAFHYLDRVSRHFNWIRSVGNVPPLACSWNSQQICTNHQGATCERRTDIYGADWDMCRWGSKNTKAKCNSTDGIWTTWDSDFANKAPGSVPPGEDGACITQVTNID